METEARFQVNIFNIQAPWIQLEHIIDQHKTNHIVLEILPQD